MSRTDPQFNLRIPESLRDKVMVAAKANKRSATAEILARLEESFAPRTLDEVETTHTAELDREIANLSMESMKLSQAMNDLLDRGRKAIQAADLQDIDCQILVLADALGKIEGERFRKVKQREMLAS